MAKLKEMSLDELYSRPKHTVAVRNAIIMKSDFSNINERYCENICGLKCKKPKQVSLLKGEVDILIIQDHREPPGRFDKFAGQQDRTMSGVVEFIAKEAGFSSLRYRMVSLLKCEATEADFPKGKAPTILTMKKCYPYLEAEIRRSKPKVIISLGTATTKALGLVKHSNTGNRGEIAISEFGPVVITLHPKILTFIRQNAKGSGGMWGPDFLKVIQNDFEKARKLATGELQYSEDTLKNACESLLGKNILIAESKEDVVSFMQEIKDLRDSKIVSFDTETTSLDVLSPKLKLLSIQFGWKTDEGDIQSRVIPLWHRENTFYSADEVWPLIEEFLLSDRPKVGHNSKYDILAIYWSKGIRVKNVAFDTLLLIHSIWSGIQGCYSLKTAVWDYMIESGLGGYEDQLGDLKKLQKDIDAEAKEEESADNLEASLFPEE